MLGLVVLQLQVSFLGTGHVASFITGIIGSTNKRRRCPYSAGQMHRVQQCTQIHFLLTPKKEHNKSCFLFPLTADHQEKNPPTAQPKGADVTRCAT